MKNNHTMLLDEVFIYFILSLITILLIRIKTMKQYILFVLSIFTSFLLRASYWDKKELSQEAVVIVPVADMTGDALSCVERSLEVQYASIPVSWGNKLETCKRIHQLLFNEVVRVVERKDGQVKCQVPNAFWENAQGNRFNEFWTLEKNLCYLKDLKESGNLSAIPQPYSENFVPQDLTKTILLEGILTLTKPWFDKETGIWYSAGTRFVLIPAQTSVGSYLVEIFYNSVKNKKILSIPQEYALVSYSKQYTISRDTLIKVLKQWAENDPKKIPYVWGGCSCIALCNPYNAKKETITSGTQELTYWSRPEEDTPYTGYDCSSLILRSTQICGMPYFFKNTTTAAKHLRSLAPTETLQNGDIIWIPGHVLVVSDVPTGECIDSRGYDPGYGFVQAIKIEKVFQNITNFDQLVEAYRKQLPLNLLSRDGSLSKEVKEYKLLSLKSIYDKE